MASGKRRALRASYAVEFGGRRQKSILEIDKPGIVYYSNDNVNL